MKTNGVLLWIVVAGIVGHLWGSEPIERPRRLHRPEVELPASSPNVIFDIDFAGSDDCLLSGDSEGYIRIWEISTRRKRCEMKLPSGVYGARYSPKDVAIIASCYDGWIRIWDLKTGGAPTLLRDPYRRSPMRIAVSPLGDRFVSTSSFDDAAPHIWSIQKRTAVTPAPQVGKLEDVAFAPDGQRFVTVHRDVGVAPYAVVWDANNGSVLGRARTSGAHYVMCTAYAPDGKTFAAGGDSGRIWLWNAQTCVMLHSMKPNDFVVRAMVYSKDSKYLITETNQLEIGDSQGGIEIWDVSTGRLVTAFLVDKAHSIRCLAISPSGNRLAGGGSDGRIRIWSIPGILRDGEKTGGEKKGLCQEAWKRRTTHMR